MNLPPPTTTRPRLTKKQRNKAKANAYYRMNVDLTRDLKTAINAIDTAKLEETLNAYLSLMTPPEDAGDTIEVQTEVLQQMSLFAAKTLTHFLIERYREK